VANIQAMTYHKHYYPDEHTGICVVRRKDESDEELLKRFRKKFSKSGIAKEFREKMYYEKPSDRKRRKKVQSIRAIQKEEEKLEKLKEKIIRKKKKQKKGAKQNDRSNRRQSYSTSSEEK
jgi:small subunit ribosomal protein S21